MPSRRRFLRRCATLGLGGLAGCVSRPDPPGAGATGTPRRTPSGTPRETPPGTVDAPQTTDGPTDSSPGTRTGADRIAWERRLPGELDHRPTLADDRVVVGTEDGTVAALARDDGSVAWQFGAEHPIQGAPVVAGDLVLAVSGLNELFENHVVHAIDLEGGRERWRFAPERWWLDVLGTRGGTAFVATSDDHLEDSGERLYALSVADGTERWSVEVGDGRGGLVTDRTAYVPAFGVVDAVDLGGTRRWRYEGGDYRYRTLGVAGETVTFVTADDPTEPTVHGLDVGTGEGRWRFEDWRAHTTRTAGDRLFVGGERVARLDPATGEPRWEADVGAALYDAPVVDGTLYVAGDAAAALSTADGTVGWRRELDAYLAFPAGVTADRLLVHRSASEEDRNRHVLALEAADGAEAWRFAGRSELTQVAVADGRAFAGEGRTLLALRA